jgi:hypothetical protein
MYGAWPTRWCSPKCEGWLILQGEQLLLRKENDVMAFLEKSPSCKVKAQVGRVYPIHAAIGKDLLVSFRAESPTP